MSAEERFLKRYDLPGCIQWPQILDPRSYIAILYSFRETNVLNYQPEIEINPEEGIIREAEQIQTAFKRKKWQDGDYIPELFGFFTCREHFGGALPTGIYIFVNKLKHHPIKDINIAFLTVYYHELTHLVIHNVTSHVPLESNYIQNFEEPFCEYVSYHLTFTEYHKRPTDNLKILNRNVSVKAPPATFIVGGHEDYENILKQSGSIFLNYSRAYPYKWFNEFNKIVNVASIEYKHLISACLNGTLIGTKRVDRPCSRAKVYLIGVEDTLPVTLQKLKKMLEEIPFWAMGNYLLHLD